MSIATEIERIKSAKNAIRSALIAKCVSVSELEAIDSYASKIESISLGIDTSDATATSADMLDGKTAYAKGLKITGNIPSKAAATYNPSTTAQEIASGQYLSGKQTIAAVTASNIPSTLKETKEVTATESEQTVSPTSGKVISSVKVNAIPSSYIGSGVTRQTAKTVTPTKSEQTAVASGVYTTGAVKVGAIPSDYIIPSGSQDITENGTFDVKSIASVIVNIAGGSSLPSGITAIDFGTINITNQFTTSRQTYSHKLGVVPDLMIVWHEGNVAQTYSMLCAIRGNDFGWRSSSYNSHYAYHGNSTTTVTWTNSSSTSYGISNMTATTFQLASSSSSYYWRTGTYNYIAIKF